MSQYEYEKREEAFHEKRRKLLEEQKKLEQMRKERKGDELKISKKNKSSTPLTEKSDKPYGQPEKAKKKKKQTYKA